MIKLYFLMALPGIAIVLAIYWILKKKEMDRALKIKFFTISSVAILTPLRMQVDIALVVGPAYIALPMGVSAGQTHILGLLKEEWMIHLVGLGLVTLISFFLASKFLFPPKPSN